MGPDAMILVFWMLSFKPTFSLFLFQQQQKNTSLKVSFHMYETKILSDKRALYLHSVGNIFFFLGDT